MRMATSNEFLTYLTECFQNIGEITFRPMMGEYLMYYRGKLLGDVCDNCVFIKPVESAKRMLPDAEFKPPYNGAKDMIVLANPEDNQLVTELFEAMYAELPERKIKKR